MCFELMIYFFGELVVAKWKSTWCMAGTENEIWQSADSDESVSRWKLLQQIKAQNESEFSNWNAKRKPQNHRPRK